MIRTIIQAGFGNQLFQYAAGYALSRELEQPLELDVSFYDYNRYKYMDNVRENNLNKLSLDFPRFRNLPNQYWQIRLLVKYPFFRKLYKMPFICEDIQNCRYDQSIIFKKIDNKGAILYGFWQNVSYFGKYKDDLSRQFTPNYQIDNTVLHYQRKIEQLESVGVHVRRGDFVRLGWSMEGAYYEKAMELISKKTPFCHFFFFTDDVTWVMERFQNRKNITIVNVLTRTKDVDEFFLLSLCKHQIISESTFGWWASFLNKNKNKKIVIPQVAKGNIFSGDHFIKI